MGLKSAKTSTSSTPGSAVASTVTGTCIGFSAVVGAMTRTRSSNSKGASASTLWCMSPQRAESRGSTRPVWATASDIAASSAQKAETERVR